MRIPGRAVLAACAVALAAGCLAGCTTPDADADPTKTPKPTPTPVFTSDADALAAATETYKKYLAISDQISHDGGRNPERIDVVATGNARDLVHENAADLQSMSLHFTGELDAAGFRLQRWDSKPGQLDIVFYACEDLTKVDIVDQSGHSVADPNREIYSPYQVTVAGKGRSSLVVSNLTEWGGGGVCLA
jgi:hypothetical protein